MDKFLINIEGNLYKVKGYNILFRKVIDLRKHKTYYKPLGVIEDYNNEIITKLIRNYTPSCV